VAIAEQIYFVERIVHFAIWPRLQVDFGFSRSSSTRTLTVKPSVWRGCAGAGRGFCRPRCNTAAAEERVQSRSTGKRRYDRAKEKRQIVATEAFSDLIVAE
jgi:hypothetical protein